MISEFTGKERDGETGLDYFESRNFSGAQGRFTSPDQPLNDQSQSEPQSWNLYTYVRNNPLKYTDPTGSACTFGSFKQMISNCVTDPLVGVAKEAGNIALVNPSNAVNGAINFLLGPTGYQLGHIDQFSAANSDQQSGMEALQFDLLSVGNSPVARGSEAASATISEVVRQSKQFSLMRASTLGQHNMRLMHRLRVRVQSVHGPCWSSESKSSGAAWNIAGRGVGS